MGRGQSDCCRCRRRRPPQLSPRAERFAAAPVSPLTPRRRCEGAAEGPRARHRPTENGPAPKQPRRCPPPFSPLTHVCQKVLQPRCGLPPRASAAGVAGSLCSTAAHLWACAMTSRQLLGRCKRASAATEAGPSPCVASCAHLAAAREFKAALHDRRSARSCYITEPITQPCSAPIGACRPSWAAPEWPGRLLHSPARPTQPDPRFGCARPAASQPEATVKWPSGP